MLSAFSENGLVTNMAAMLHDGGVTLGAAALALSVRGGAGILGRLATGYLIDRLPAQRMQTFILLLSAAGTLVLAFAVSSPVASLGAALLGVGLGSEADIAPYLLARYFGRKNFSVLYGLTWTAYAVGGATAHSSSVISMTVMAPTSRAISSASRQSHFSRFSLACFYETAPLPPSSPTMSNPIQTLSWRKTMPHIALPENMPGITAGFAFRPDTANPMRELAHILLHTSANENFGSRDRELIATFVSSRNTCYFCATSHGAAATHLHGGDASLVEQVIRDYKSAPLPDKRRSRSGLHLAARPV